jgi:hypothetical protein
MDADEIRMHLLAGADAGRERTCGRKITHPTQEVAQVHADHLNRRRDVLDGERSRCEPYPCVFCSGGTPGVYTWHVGREMAEGERDYYRRL